MDTAERTETPTEIVYDGFISYSHAADGLLAPRLQAGLQRFAKPWWKRRALRVFRDESSLSANPHLWASITDALDSSAWFVLLLSPDAATSQWVNQEIDYWRTHRDPSRILPVVTDGEFGWDGSDVSGSAVPESLRNVFSEEPRWVDLRFARDEEQLDLKDPRFADAVADIASALRGVPKDELASEEVRQHRRTIRTAWAGGALVAVLAIAATGFAVQSADNAERAETQAARAEEEAARAEASADAEADARARAEANAEAEVEARTEAEASAQLARAREWAASAIGVVDADPRLAIWLALIAIDATPEGREQPVEVINALWKAVAADPLIATIDHGFGGTTFVDLSPDDRALAISSAEGATLELRDAESFEILWSYSEETEDGFARPVFSPDGSSIAMDVMGSEAEDAWRKSGVDELANRVIILDSTSGEVVEVLEFPECQNVWAPAWSPDGTRLAVSPGFEGGCVRDQVDEPIWIEVFDTGTWESEGLIGIEGDDRAIRAIFLSDDRLGAFRSHNPLEVYDSSTLELVDVLDEVHSPLVPDVSRSGGLIGAHSNETLLGYLYDLDTGSQLDVLGQLEAWPNIPFGVSLSEDGGRIAYATEGRVLVWEVASGEQIHQLNAGSGAMNAVFDGAGSRLYSAHRDGTVRVWDLSSQQGRVVDSLATFSAGSHVNGNGFRLGTEIGIFVRFEFVPEFKAFMEVFSTETGRVVADPVVTDGQFVALPNDLAVAQPAGAARHLVFDPRTGEGKEVGPECTDGECMVVLSATRAEFAIVSPSTEGSLLWHFFDAETAESTGTESHDSSRRLADGFGDDWVLTGDPSGNLRFIDRDSGDAPIAFEEVVNFPVEFSADGRIVALRLERAITLVDTEAWESTILDLGFGRMRGLAFDADGSRLAVADEDELLIVDLGRREVIQEIPIPLVSDIHWIDESTLLVGDRSGAVWGTVSLDTTELIERARSAVEERPITVPECRTYRIDPCPALDAEEGG